MEDSTKYDFVECINEAIQECLLYGSGVVKRVSEDGKLLRHIEAHWRPRGFSKDVVEVSIFDPYTGAVVYSTEIDETEVDSI